MYSRTARVSTVRWNLKEAVSESLVRRTEIAYKARLRVISWQRTVKSNNYHVCRSRVNAADLWGERACNLSVEISQRFHLPSNNELWEVSRTHSSEEVSVMEMERRGEQMTKERLINSGFYDLAIAYQSVHVNYWKRRIPNGTYGAVRGRRLVTASYSIKK